MTSYMGSVTIHLTIDEAGCVQWTAGIWDRGVSVASGSGPSVWLAFGALAREFKRGLKDGSIVAPKGRMVS